MPLIIGIVESGFGAATRNVQEGRYADLPYQPYPGTLNIGVKEWPELPEPDMRISFRGSSPDLKLWKARVNGLKCHLMLVANSNFELLSPHYLREALGVVDGDEVQVAV